MAWLWAMMFIIGTVILLFRGGGDAALAAMMAGAGEAVTLCLELAGSYLLFLGLIGVLKKGGYMEALSRRLSGIVRWLFPGAGGAAGAIALTLSANILGLGNAATPFGLTAMRIMEEENPHKGIATYDMCAFIAINASALQLLPTTVIAIRSAAGSAAPASIVPASIIGTLASTLAAVLLCRLIRR